MLTRVRNRIGCGIVISVSLRRIYWIFAQKKSENQPMENLKVPLLAAFIAFGTLLGGACEKNSPSAQKSDALSIRCDDGKVFNSDVVALSKEAAKPEHKDIAGKVKKGAVLIRRLAAPQFGAPADLEKAKPFCGWTMQDVAAFGEGMPAEEINLKRGGS
jgi:hypothetical protein